jgi:hypothetical protein
MVLTRDIPVGAASGRERTMAQIRTLLSRESEVRELRLSNITERRGIVPWLMAGFEWLLSVLLLRPLPLQVALFTDHEAVARLKAEIDEFKPDSIYFDGIRTGPALMAARAHAGRSLRLVCDFDDLMSRRMRLLSEMNLGISAGYLKRFIPVWFQKHVLNGPLSRLVTRYEAATLRHLELLVLEHADQVTLVSEEDAKTLRSQAGPDEGKVLVVPPSAAVARPLRIPREPIRFIFIGGDAQTQNRLTIEWLIELWRKYSPKSSVHLYGKIGRRESLPENVIIEGFAESLDDVYTPDSILLAPSFLCGGIKTKILEAWVHGNLVIGNRASFEGMGLDMDGLSMTDEELVDFIRNPQSSVDRLICASKIVQGQFWQRFDGGRIRDQWLRAAFGSTVERSLSVSTSFPVNATAAK